MERLRKYLISVAAVLMLTVVVPIGWGVAAAKAQEFDVAHEATFTNAIPGWDTPEVKSHANGIAVDYSGRLFVGNPNKFVVQSFLPFGQGNAASYLFPQIGSYPCKEFLIPPCAGEGDGQFTSIWDLAFDTWGRLYVADAQATAGDPTKKGRVQVFDPKPTKADFLYKIGQQGPSSGSVYVPTSVAVDRNGRVFVGGSFKGTDLPGDFKVRVFDSFENLFEPLAFFGEKGSADGQFGSTVSLAIDSMDRVYATDFANNRVQVFKGMDASMNYSSDAFLGPFGSYGGAQGEFDGPAEIAIDSLDRVYIADINNHRVQVFDSFENGNKFLASIGFMGVQPGQFTHVLALALDGTRLYASDLGGSAENPNTVNKFPRIQRFRVDDADADGVFDTVDNCPGLANPSQEDWNENGIGSACDESEKKHPDGPNDDDTPPDTGPDTGPGDTCISTKTKVWLTTARYIKLKRLAKKRKIMLKVLGLGSDIKARFKVTVSRKWARKLGIKKRLLKKVIALKMGGPKVKLAISKKTARKLTKAALSRRAPKKLKLLITMEVVQEKTKYKPVGKAAVTAYKGRLNKMKRKQKRKVLLKALSPNLCK